VTIDGPEREIALHLLAIALHVSYMLYFYLRTAVNIIVS
jgi:hypothetical protein